jgi:tetratricopeptide (TPR) repeat protein
MMVRYWGGDLIGAEQHFLTGLKFFDDPGFRRSQTGGAIAAFCYGSHSAWILGRPELALVRLDQMMCAVNGNNLHDLATARHYAASVRPCRGEFEQAAALATQALQISENNQFPNEAAMERIVLGQARAWLGSVAECIALMRQGIASMLDSGQRLGIAVQSARLAEVQIRAGLIRDALVTLKQALREEFDEPVFRPEILRIRGELLLERKQIESAKSDLSQAAALARRMGAKAFELRSTTGLARLIAKQGHREEARKLLAEIYNWFTEGFDTADLKDAKGLLDDLAS